MMPNYSVAMEGNATVTTGGVDARSHNLGAKDGHDDSLPGEPSRTCAPGHTSPEVPA